MWITQATSNKLGNANVSIYTSKHSGTYGINKKNEMIPFFTTNCRWQMQIFCHCSGNE